MGDILVITEHLKGEFQDITFEMLGKAKELAGASGGQCVAVTFGNMNGKSGELGVADSVISVGGSNDFFPTHYWFIPWNGSNIQLTCCHVSYWRIIWYHHGG